MTKLTSLEQARELQVRTRAARYAFRNPQSITASGLVESEVKFRFDAIDGMLIMALNDTGMLVKTWEETT